MILWEKDNLRIYKESKWISNKVKLVNKIINKIKLMQVVDK